MTFQADGTAVGTDSTGLTWHGAWESTGVDSALFTFTSIDMQGASSSFSGDAAVEPGGERWNDVSDGIPPGTAYAERIVAERFS